MDMRARTDHPVLDAVADRWSPYAFDPRPVDDADLRSIFEAARWAASSYNEQPWRFLVVRREDEEAFAAALDCLVEFNQGWARDASVLAFAVAAPRYERNGEPNDKASYDLGQAVALLSLEAVARGLEVHQMGGFDPRQAGELHGVPEDHAVVTCFALGHAAAPNEGGGEGRSRRPLSDFVYGPRWEVPAEFLD